MPPILQSDKDPASYHAVRYNEMGETFLNYENTPVHHVEVRNVMRLIGDVRGKSVLDLACGYGFFSLKMKKMGAAEIVGVDISAKMLALAREMTQKADYAIEYHLGDAAQIEFSRKFDLVTAVFLFNYAETMAELTAMFNTAARHLRRGGRLIACTENPNYNPASGSWDQYYVKLLRYERVNSELHKFRLTFDGTEDNAFTCFQWSQRAYETAAKNAGLTNLHWHAPELLPEDIDAQKPGFWDIFQNNCIYIFFTCEI